MMLAVFVVNLKKDVEKKAHMEVICKRHFPNVRFVEAVYGKALTQHEVNRVYSENETGRSLSRGEIGCALSHREIYRAIVKEGIGTALILEDDIELDENIEEVIDAVEGFPVDWDIVLLGHHTRFSRSVGAKSSVWWSKRISKNYRLNRLAETGLGTYGYLINRRGAKKLLKRLDTIKKPIDHYTGSDKDVNVYAVNPPAVQVHDHLSDTFHSMGDRAEIQTDIRKEGSREWLKRSGIFEMLVSLLDSLKMLVPPKQYWPEDKSDA